MIVGQVVCDRPTPVMTSESDFVVSQTGDELIDIGRQRSFVIADERALPGLRPTMQKDQRITGARHDVVHAKAVHFQRVMGPRVWHGLAPVLTRSVGSEGIFADGTVRLQVWRGLLDIASGQCQGYEQTGALPTLHLSS